MPHMIRLPRLFLPVLLVASALLVACGGGGVPASEDAGERAAALVTWREALGVPLRQ